MPLGQGKGRPKEGKILDIKSRRPLRIPVDRRAVKGSAVIVLPAAVFVDRTDIAFQEDGFPGFCIQRQLQILHAFQKVSLIVVHRAVLHASANGFQAQIPLTGAVLRQKLHHLRQKAALYAQRDLPGGFQGNGQQRANQKKSRNGQDQKGKQHNEGAFFLNGLKTQLVLPLQMEIPAAPHSVLPFWSGKRHAQYSPKQNEKQCHCVFRRPAQYRQDQQGEKQ